MKTSTILTANDMWLSSDRYITYTINVLAGADTVWGGQHADTINWGNGNDNLHGGTVSTFVPDDLLDGGNDDDQLATAFLDGGNDNDLPQDGNGNDTLDSGVRNDALEREIGIDNLHGAAGIDKLHGGDGGDTLSGGQKNDRSEGDGGDHQPNGDNGNDVLLGGSGSNFLYDGEADYLVHDGLHGVADSDYDNISHDSDGGKSLIQDNAGVGDILDFNTGITSLADLHFAYADADCTDLVIFKSGDYLGADLAFDGIVIDNFFNVGGKSAGVAAGAIEYVSYTVGGTSYLHDLIATVNASGELA